MEHKKIHGQYFTKNSDLQNKAYEFIKNNPSVILEPSCGAGHLVMNYPNKETRFDCYELDENIDFIIKKEDIHFGDFLEQNIVVKYKTILGNPPYVKTNKGNLYIDFIDRCVDYLAEEGELVFIIPSDFLKLTSAVKTINKMMEIGHFTDIYHPHDEHLFDNATIDVIVFRYVKTKNKDNKIQYNGTEMYINANNGIITFSDNELTDNKIISDFFNVYVGMVTGKEKIYKNKELGNFKMLNGKDKIDDYIFIKEYPSTDVKINKYLEENKEVLIKRKIKKFNENNWFEWGAPRNISKIEENLGKKCIYVKNLTRNDEIAFKGEVNYFGGSLIMLLPKEETTDLDEIVEYLNTEEFKKNYTYAKRFKIGQKQLLNGIINI